jgi:hypothetical protein
MTRDQLRDLCNSLLGGAAIDDTLFDTLVNLAKDRREEDRPWMILRTEDTSQSASSANTYLTAETLPSNFRRFYGEYPIQLLNSAGTSLLRYRQIPLERKILEKDNDGKFYVNYATGEFFLCGLLSQSYTIHQFYLKTTDDIADGSNWVFPSRFHRILAFEVAVMYKLGVDYDIINNVQGDNNAAVANAIYATMTQWDDDLQNAAQSGVDYEEYAQS